MERLARNITSNPKKIIFAFILITIIFANRLPLLKINTSTKSLVAKDVSYRLFYEEVKKDFGNEEVIILVLESENIFSYEKISKIKELTETIEELNYIDEVKSIINAKHIKSSDEMINIKPLFKEIPKTYEEILKLKEEAIADKLLANRLISKDGNNLAIYIFLKNLNEDEIYKKRIIESVVNNLELIIKNSNLTATTSYYLGGTPILRSKSSNYMHKDLVKYIPFTALIMIILLSFCFGSIRGTLLPLASLLMVMIWDLGLVSFMGKEINIVTIIVPSLLLAIGCAYLFHFMNQYYLEVEKEKGADGKKIVTMAITNIGKPLLFIAATTIVGFGSLGISDIAPVKDFGILLSFGIFCILMGALFFVPSFLCIIPPPKNTLKHDVFEKSLFKFGKIVIARPILIVLTTIIILIISIVGITELKVETNHLSFFKKDDKVRIDNQLISKKLSGVNIMSVILESNKEDAFKKPFILKKMVVLQNYLESFKEIDCTSSIADYIRQINMAMNSDDTKFWTIPDSQQLVAQYLLLYSNGGEPDVFDRYIDYNFKKASILYHVNIYNLKFYLELAEKIKAFANSIFPEDIKVDVTGSLIVSAKTFDKIVETQVESIILATIIISVLIFFLFRSFKLGIIAMIPNTLPIFINFGLMGWLGIRLDLPSSIIAATALGIAVDDTIHFTNRYCYLLKRSGKPEESVIKTFQLTGFPIIITSITIASGFLILTL